MNEYLIDAIAFFLPAAALSFFALICVVGSFPAKTVDAKIVLRVVAAAFFCGVVVLATCGTRNLLAYTLDTPLSSSAKCVDCRTVLVHTKCSWGDGK
jgi:hypothetical protein